MSNIDVPYKISYDCSDCSMKFENARQLANHVKNFCIASQYGHMSGLIAAQERDTKYNRVEPNGSHLIGDYGKQTLGRMRQAAGLQQNNLTQNALRNKQQELLDDMVLYRERQRKLVGGASGVSNSGEPNNRILIESQVRSVGGSRGFVSPPSMPYPSNYSPYNPNSNNARNDSLEPVKLSRLNNTQINMMSPQQRWDYADNKLRQLEGIKQSYMENGGNDVYFLSHLQSLYRFYTELKTAERVSQVRLPSPVDRLKELGETSVGTTKGVRQSRNRVLQQEIMSPTTGAKQGQHQSPYIQPKPYQPALYPQYQGYPPYAQQQQPPYPPIIIMPQPSVPPPVSAPPRVDPSSYLQKLLSLKDQQNRKLLKLLQTKPQASPPPPTRNISTSLHHSTTSSVRPELTAEKVYQMQPIEEDLLPEQRALISLEKQQLDQLRLLSSLPEDLQKIKFQTVKNMMELRTNLEKELQKQRLERMKYQMEQQAKQQNRMFENQLWVDEQRKKALSQRLGDEDKNM